MADEDIQFTFDAESIIAPLNKIIKKFDDLTNVIKATESKTTPAIKKTQTETKAVGVQGQKTGFLMNASLTKLVAAWGLLKGGIASAKAALLGMPEIGRTFKIAGDIMLRNFLQPIRQTLLPLLNKVLTWVKDNRARFVEWGSLVLNVIEAVIGVVKQFIEVLKKVFESFTEVLEGTLGQFTQSFADTMRVIITKIAATFIFILILLEPLFKVIGKLLAFIVIGFRGLFAGIGDNIKFVLGPLQDLIQALADMFETILGGKDGAMAFFEFMRRIGRIIALVFANVVNGIVAVVKWITKFIEGFKEGFSAVEGIGDAFDELIDAFEDYIKTIKEVIFENEAIVSIFRFIGKVLGFVIGLFIKLVVKVFTIYIKSITWLIKNLPKLIKLIGQGLKNAFKVVGSAIDGVIKFFQNFFSKAVKIITKVKNFFTGIWKGIANTAKKAFDSILRSIKSVFNAVESLFFKITDFLGITDRASDKTAALAKDREKEIPTPKFRPIRGAGSVRNDFNDNRQFKIELKGGRPPEDAEAMKKFLKSPIVKKTANEAIMDELNIQKTGSGF